LDSIIIKQHLPSFWILKELSKLIKAEIPAQFINIIHNDLNNTAFTLVHGNSETIRRPIQAGVPRDSLLVSVLFNIYINDIPFLENDNNVDVSVHVGNTNVTVRSGAYNWL
jgi:hypothetical protein